MRTIRIEIEVPEDYDNVVDDLVYNDFRENPGAWEMRMRLVCDTKESPEPGGKSVIIVDGKFVCEECKELGVDKDEYTHPISDVIVLGDGAPLICKECYSSYEADQDLLREHGVK